MKFMPPDALILAQNAPKMCLAAGLCPDPLGELTALPRPSSWIEGVLLLRGGKEWGREGRGGEGRGEERKGMERRKGEGSRGREGEGSEGRRDGPNFVPRFGG